MDNTNKWYEYLHIERKLSPRVIQQAGLTVVDDYLVIPIVDRDGYHLFNKSRRAPWADESLPKYKNEAGASASLYGIDTIKDAHEVFITEGELDTLAVRTCGHTAVSGTGGAGTFKQEWVDELGSRSVVVLYDNDDAGIKGAVKLALMLKDCTYRWVPPRYGKDISDVLMNYDEQTISELLTGPDNALHIHIPSFTNDADIKAYRSELGVTIADMSSGSIGTLFLRELIVQLSCMLTPKRKARAEDFDTSAIARARAYPIENLIQVKNKTALCPFHNEKTPSLHVYPNNTTYCFGGCAKAYDVIDIYAKLHNLDVKRDFKTILDRLSSM